MGHGKDKDSKGQGIVGELRWRAACCVEHSFD